MNETIFDIRINRGQPRQRPFARLLRTALGLAALASIVIGVGRADTANNAGGESAPMSPSSGPKLGEKVPDFELPDQNAQEHSLQRLMGANGLLLVFVRSADW